MSEAIIPTFYRVFFTWIDPMVALWGAYMDVVNPDVVMNAYIPNSARNADHDMLFHHNAGSLVCIAIIDSVLLRYTKDMQIWKIVQFSTLTFDIAILSSFYWALNRQGRLGVSDWRGEDWGCLAITATATLMRVLFLAGLGVGNKVANSKKAL